MEAPRGTMTVTEEVREYLSHPPSVERFNQLSREAQNWLMTASEKVLISFQWKHVESSGPQVSSRSAACTMRLRDAKFSEFVRVLSGFVIQRVRLTRVAIENRLYHPASSVHTIQFRSTINRIRKKRKGS